MALKDRFNKIILELFLSSPVPPGEVPKYCARDLTHVPVSISTGAKNQNKPVYSNPSGLLSDSFLRSTA